MQIKPVSNLYFTKFTNNYNKKNLLTKCDSFEKTSFQGASIQENVNSFAKSFEKIVFEDGFDFKKTKNIIRQYIKDIDVKPMEELDQNTLGREYTIAYFKCPLGFDYNGNIIKQQKTIYIKTPKDSSDEEKARVFKNTVHEFTHALQENEEGNKSNYVLLKKFCQKDMPLNTRFNTIKIAPAISKAVESTYFQELARALQKDTNTPSLIDKINPKGIAGLLKKENLEDEMKFFINSYISLAEKQTEFLDKKFLVEYIKLASEKEAQAYKLDLDETKEALNIKGVTDMDYIPLLYSSLSNACESILKEF